MQELKKNGSVLVAGGGVGGIQASLDLSALGFKVYLVEKSSMIGGKMAQLDKTFPTNDCSMCILSPKMVECERNPNIDILSNSEIQAVAGEPGNFSVTLVRKPRYVKEEDCTGCGTCTTYCPVRVPDAFNENLSLSKAIDILCPQAVPAVSLIDKNKCLYFKGKCKICWAACKAKAIDFKQEEEQIVLNVGAIILTPGYKIFDGKLAGEYGYKRFKNVVSSMEFERLLNADGPHKGEILRPSDNAHPLKIAWFQCVGSRDARMGSTYCSTVCCMYALKQMILAKEHYPEIETTMFYNDLRAFGKGYEDFYARAQSMPGIQFVGRRVSSVKENRRNGNIIVTYVSEQGVKEEEYNLVVLSAGITHMEGNEHFAGTIGIDLNEHGFCQTGVFTPNQAVNRPGIFPAGTFTGPMDIPDSISSVAGAVSLASQLLWTERGKLVQPKSYPVERNVEGEEPRIGVFVCRCGANIGRVVDVPSVKEFAGTLENVVYAEETLFACSLDNAHHISSMIKDKGLNRLVVGACTPRTHEPLFQETLREAGINKYLFEMANIREHCSWVHAGEKDKATQKAKGLIEMAVARSRSLAPLKEIELSINKQGLILGGGLAGLTAALALARQGFHVYLVEKEEQLGGNLRVLRHTLEGLEIKLLLERLIGEIENTHNITVYKGFELRSVTGFVGNFKSTLRRVHPGQAQAPSIDQNEIEVEHGVTIVATGGRPHEPTEYHYGKSNKILTQLELENLIASDPCVKDLKQVAFIQCVGSRNEERGYCSRICCGEAIKNALELKRLNKDMKVIVFYRDIRTYGFREDFYARARQEGVLFIQYTPETKPEIKLVGTNISLRYDDPFIKDQGVINPDLVVLSTPVVPANNREVSQLLKVPLTNDGFFLEAHAKLRPLDFATEGVFLCGMAHYPKYIPETISQANGAAARAAIIVSQHKLVSSGIISRVEKSTCTGCALCEKVCPYSAVKIEETGEGKKAEVIAALCKGCGVCNSICPTTSITQNHFTDQQIFAQIEAAFSQHEKRPAFEPKILAFLCNWCGYAGADLAGVSRLQYSANIRVIRVMCSGRVSRNFVARAFLQGVDGVMVCGCHQSDCHYISPINETIKMVERTKGFLARLGLDERRLRLEHISAGEGAKFTQAVNDFNQTVSDLGALNLSGDQREQLHKVFTKRNELKS